jgi:hypothetical protein
MASRTSSRLRQAAFVSFIAVVLAGLFAAPTLATLQPIEQILRVARYGHPEAGLGQIESRLIFPPGARWEVDPEAGPLTLEVEFGKVGVVLGGGQARIVRYANPLQEIRIHRLQPEQMAYLWPGDKLTVVRGYGVRVDNDDHAPAMALVSRVVREPLPVLSNNH